ncbi:hypothetical protein EMIT0373P_11387 [Pseudomonas chlororaphis]
MNHLTWGSQRPTVENKHKLLISGTLNLDPKATSGLSIPLPERLRLFISSNFAGFYGWSNNNFISSAIEFFLMIKRSLFHAHSGCRRRA